MIVSQTKLLTFAEFTICKLVDGVYQMEKFVKGDRLRSNVFPELDLTSDRVFQAAGLQIS